MQWSPSEEQACAERWADTSGWALPMGPLSLSQTKLGHQQLNLKPYNCAQKWRKGTRTRHQTPPEATSSAANLMCTNGFFPFLCSQSDMKSSPRWLLSVIIFHANTGPDWCLSTPKSCSHQEGMNVRSLSRFCRQFAVFLAHFPHHHPCPLHSMVCRHYQHPPHQHWNCIKGRKNLHFGCAGLDGKARRTLFLGKAAARSVKSSA